MDKIARRNTIIIFICVVAVFLTIIGILVFPFIRPNFDRRYRTKEGILTPTQITVTGSTRLSGDGWSGTARHRATYTIWGIVMNNTSYDSDSVYDKVSPLDIGLAWGDMAKHNNLVKWVRGYRHVTASINALAKWYINKSTSTLFQQFSNNHLIFTDEDLLVKARNVQLGDYIKIKGYLVDVDAHRSNEPAIKYSFNTSLTRNDDGEESCEVILVTSLEVLD